MTRKEMLLAAALLDIASERFANHGCNDFRLDDHIDMSADEKRALDLDMHERNGDPEKHDASRNHDWQDDWALMQHCAELLREEAGGTEG